VASNGLGLFLTGLPPSLTIDFAARAEASGWEAAWFPEITFGDSFGPATAAALQTERIGIATGVVGVWSRSAVTMALQAATLHQLSQGRLILGLGVQARGYVRAWHGQEYRKPVTAMRDFVTILRRIFAGELASYDGEVFSVRNFHLDMELPEAPLKIYIAANGPRMAELAGEIADGTVGWFHSLEYVRDVTMPAIRRGAERAGRSLDDFDVTVGFPAVVTRDDSGIEKSKGLVMMFATALDSAPVALVPDEMAAAMVMAGSVDRVRAKIESYRAAGLTGIHLLPSPPGGYYPLYEGHFPVESLSQLPEFDFPALIGSFSDAVELLA
jgi:alkanesulfonate monooxygenase SsuD/methylene tetrahydromethanopterin reductase-like flavin-dependent oxidoreductase (luciferase family)